MTKIKNRFINNSECLMPSVLTDSVIFSVIDPKKTDRTRKNKEVIVRTKLEGAVFEGPKLDLKNDYPLFHIILRENQIQGSIPIYLKANDILKELGMQCRTINKVKIFNKLKVFEGCKLSISKIKTKTNEAASTLRLPLVSKVNTSEDYNTITIEFPQQIDFFIELFDTQKVDLSFYKKLTKQSARGIYLTLSSYAYISNKVLKIAFEKFMIRFNENKEFKHKNTAICEGLEELKEKGFFKSFEFYTSKNDKRMCKIIFL